MLKTIQYSRVTLLSLLLILLPVLPACQATFSQEAQVRIATLEEHNKTLEQKAQELSDALVQSTVENQAKAAELEMALSRGDITIEEYEERKAEFEQRLVDMATLIGELKDTKSTIEKNDLTISEIEMQETDGVVATAGALLAPFIPGAPAIAALVSGGVVPLLFPRSRKHAVKALQEISPFEGRPAPVKALKSLAKMLGAYHTNDTPEEMLAALEKFAAQQGKVIMQNGSGKIEVHDESKASA